MNELVHARGTQSDTEIGQAQNEVTEAKKKKKTTPFDIIAMITASMAAFEALTGSDLAELATKTKETVKNPLLAVGIVAVYAYMVMNSAN